MNGDDLYVLHSDGRLSMCSYSRIEAVPTRCVDPAPLINSLEAYRDQDLFAQAHFTQLALSPPPDSSLGSFRSSSSSPPNTADQLRSGAPVHLAGGGRGRHLSSPYGVPP